MSNIHVNLGRKLSLENATAIGHGYCSDVYRIDDETVVKVLKSCDIQNAEREIQLSKWALINGIPTAISYDVVDVNGHPGLVYELLGKGSLRDWLVNHPDDHHRRMRQYVDLLKSIHAVRDTDARLPKAVDYYKQILEEIPYLTEDERNRMHTLLDSIPDSINVVHCDSHIKNIKIVNDELMLIDLDTLAQGDPIFEFRSIYCAYRAFNEARGYTEFDPFFNLPVEMEERILDSVLRLYFDHLNEADFAENIQKIATLSYLHMLSFYYHCKEKDEYDLPNILNLFRESLVKTEDLRLKY